MNANKNNDLHQQKFNQNKEKTIAPCATQSSWHFWIENYSLVEDSSVLVSKFSCPFYFSRWTYLSLLQNKTQQSINLRKWVSMYNLSASRWHKVFSINMNYMCHFSEYFFPSAIKSAHFVIGLDAEHTVHVCL